MDRFNLGAYRRAVTTQSAEAQRWFDKGLNWCYGFNHDEGVKCFERALAADPSCAMALWGIAYATGPFYNLTWKEHGPVEAQNATRLCLDHVQRALALAHRATDVEQHLIAALARRFQKPQAVSSEEFGMGRRLRFMKRLPDFGERGRAPDNPPDRFKTAATRNPARGLQNLSSSC